MKSLVCFLFLSFASTTLLAQELPELDTKSLNTPEDYKNGCGFWAWGFGGLKLAPNLGAPSLILHVRSAKIKTTKKDNNAVNSSWLGLAHLQK